MEKVCDFLVGILGYGSFYGFIRINWEIIEAWFMLKNWWFCCHILRFNKSKLLFFVFEPEDQQNGMTSARQLLWDSCSLGCSRRSIYTFKLFESAVSYLSIPMKQYQIERPDINSSVSSGFEGARQWFQKWRHVTYLIYMIFTNVLLGDQHSSAFHMRSNALKCRKGVIGWLMQ